MAKKKWITKQEITSLLKTYSVRSGEFEPFGDEGYSFKSKFERSYVISLEPEIQYGSEKTGRIIVSHSQGNGKLTFQDIWERDANGKLQFVFRNPWNVPPTDYDYIHDLESQIKEIKETGLKMIQNQKIQGISNEGESASHQLTDLVEQIRKKNDLLESENKELKEKIKFLEELNQNLINKTGHNARGAGRKANPQHLENQIKRVQSLIEKGKSISEIQQIMGISRSSYFRYKKFIKDK